MRKTIILGIFMAAFLLFAPPIQAASSPTVYINGRSIGREEGSLHGGTSYMPLRALADFTGGKLTWDAKTRTAGLTARGLTLTATYGDPYLLANGRALYAETGIRIEKGRTMIPCRLAARILNGTARWESKTRSVYITAGKDIIENADSHYDPDALLWLSRIISSESQGEPLRGQIAVGNVILNRVESRAYPNTIWGVIFDRKHGIQFEPVLNGSIYKTPSASAVIAAKLCLEGVDLSRGSLYFYNPAIAQSNWIGKNRPYIMTIGGHDFHA